MLFWIHGGPVSAWFNVWSTRWNLIAFAEQGYIIVACNCTRSLGFGQDFVRGIKGEWGGRPYSDSIKIFEYVKDNLGYVDPPSLQISI